MTATSSYSAANRSSAPTATRSFPPKQPCRSTPISRGRNDPDAAKADDVDGAIGEGSQFHSEWGYYAQGVEVSTAVLPAGWEDRVEIFHRDDTEHTWARCLEPHDLCIAKLVAGREKDIDFVTSLIRANLIDPERLHDLVDNISRPHPIVHATRQRVQVCAARAKRSPPGG